MACILDSGYVLGCLDNTGGVKAVYIANYDLADTFTLDGTGAVSTITPGDSGATAIFYTFAQAIETASYTENGTISVENGTSFYESTATISLNKLTQLQKNQIDKIIKGALRVMILDNNGIYHLLGYSNPVRTTGAEMGVGQTFGDRNGVVLTFSTKEQIPSPTVLSATAIGAIL